MILIISSEDDITTKKIQSWLHYFGEDHIRINDSSHIRVIKYELDNNKEDIELLINDELYKDKILSLKSVKAVWYRRGFMNIKLNIFLNKHLSTRDNNTINEYLHKEKLILKHAILSYINERNISINSEFDTEINKLVALKIAKKNGLSIPSTFISSSPCALKNYVKDRKKIITKAINESGFKLTHYEISGGTHEIKKIDFLRQNAINIGLSQLQEKLGKAYELRIFFIMDEYYPSAIFSQSNKKTMVDFRNYDNEQQNRVVPYILPDEIKCKLTRTMADLKLNCGSIDMVVTKKNEFVFLEVNPIGQFEQVSYPCNYFLPKIIAHVLIKIKNESTAPTQAHAVF